MSSLKKQFKRIFVSVIAEILCLAVALPVGATQQYSNISDLNNDVVISGDTASLVLDYYPGRSENISFAAVATNNNTGEIKVKPGTKSGPSTGALTFSVDLSEISNSDIKFYLWDENETSVVNSAPTPVNEFVTESKAINTKIEWNESFDDNGAIESYQIYDATTNKLIGETKSLYYIDGRTRVINPATEYKYKVIAVDSNNIKSLFEDSSTISVTTDSINSWNENTDNGVTNIINPDPAREAYAEVVQQNGRTALLAPSSRSQRNNGQVYSLTFKAESMESETPYDTLSVKVDYLDTLGGKLVLNYKYLDGESYKTQSVSGPELNGTGEWKTFMFVINSFAGKPKPCLVATTGNLSNGHISFNTGVGYDLYVSDVTIFDDKCTYSSNDNIGSVKNLSALKNSSGITITWNAPSSGVDLVDKYNIYDNSTGFLIGESFNNTFDDTRELLTDSPCEYRVVAVDRNGLEGAEAICTAQPSGDNPGVDDGDNENGEGSGDNTGDNTEPDDEIIFASGDGTENNAYVIENATQLAKLAEYVNGSDAENWNGKYYKLGADIDLNNMSWTPIGSANDKPFKGNFDGAGHVIKNLNVTLTSTLKTSGLFGFIDGATIKNVGINGATVATESGLEYDGVSTNRWIAGVLIGAVVDQSTGNVISDCYIKNANMNLTITTSSSASDLTPLESAGTIVGCSYTSKASTAKVSNCYTVNATITGSNGAGGSLKVKTAATGLIGATAQKWTIENCYAADVEITGFGNIANLIRSATDNKPTITNCYTYNVTFPSWANKSYTDGTVTTVTEDELKAVPEGLAGSFVADTENGYPVLKWEVTSDDEDDNTEPDDEIVFASGDGTENNAYVIENTTQLATLAEYVNGDDAEDWNAKYYKLGADIDLNNMAWTPIGSVKEKPFKGNFDGAGHVIKNLNVTLTSTLKTSGLFGFIDGATIKNVGINGATVATESGLEYDGVSTNRWIAGVLIGAVVDQSTGNVISDCYIKNANMNLTITTSSSASDLTPLESAGTIVGCSYTSKASTAKVSNCYTVNATITGSNGAGGSLKVKTAATGLIGATAQKWTIENCYAADVEITGFGNIANLIRSETGSNKPTITNCYSCNVTQGSKSYTDGTVINITEDELKAVPEGLKDLFEQDTNGGFPNLKTY